MMSKCSERKMERLKKRFIDGALANDVPLELAEKIFLKLKDFSNFGFRESRALSFALLVFASAYFKLYHPDAFCAGLLRANVAGRGKAPHDPDRAGHRPHDRAEAGRADRGRADAYGPFANMADVARRVRLTTPQVEALATARAFAGFGGDRRQAQWTAGAVAGERPEKLPGLAGSPAPTLPGMDGVDLAAAHVWATRGSPDSFPTQSIRERPDELGVVPAGRLAEHEDGARVLIGGAVTHRQRPATAGGITFLNIEDETGMANVICALGLWQRYHRVARSSPAPLIRGVVEKADGVVSLLADRIEALPMRITAKSRDFR